MILDMVFYKASTKVTFVPKMLRSNKAMANSHKSAVSPKQKIRPTRQSVSLQYRLPIL